MMSEEKKPEPVVIDAEFVEEKVAEKVVENPKPKESHRGGFGTSVVAGATVSEAVADVLDASGTAARGVSKFARAIGKQDTAAKVDHVAEVASKAADVARAVPHAVAGIEKAAVAAGEATKPLRDALGRLKTLAKEKGMYTRKEPRSVEHAPKRRHGKPMSNEEASAPPTKGNAG
jgi:hypothetical protein